MMKTLTQETWGGGGKLGRLATMTAASLVIAGAAVALPQTEAATYSRVDNTDSTWTTTTGGHLGWSDGKGSTLTAPVNTDDAVLGTPTTGSASTLTGTNETINNLKVSAAGWGIDGKLTVTNALTVDSGVSFLIKDNKSASGVYNVKDVNLNGQIVVESGAQLNVTGVITMDGGVLKLTTTHTTPDNVAFRVTGKSTVLGANGGTFDVAAGVNLTFNDTISGTGNLIHKGDGGLILSGNNGFSGNITVTDGKLTASHANALGTGAEITLGSGTELASTVDIALGNRTINVAPGNARKMSATLAAGTANDDLRITGGGKLIVSGDNSKYLGITTLTADTKIDAQSANALGIGKLNLENGAKIESSNNTNVNLNSSEIIVDSGNAAISAILAGTGKSLVKYGAGTLTLSGVNTYTGGTTINNGTLELSVTGKLASAVWNTIDGIVINAGDINATVTNDGTFTNAKDAKINAGVVNNVGATFANDGLIDDVLTNEGTFTNNADGSVWNVGNKAGATFTNVGGEITGSFLNEGMLTIAGDTATTIESNKTLTNKNGATLTSGLYQDSTNDDKWTSNLITDGTGKIVFDAGSTWTIQENGFTGGDIEGVITADSDAANAALVETNKRMQLYNFVHADDALSGKAKEKANIADTVANTPIMFQPQALYSSVGGRLQQQFGSVYGGREYRGQECDPCAPVCGKGVASKLSFWTNYIGRSTELVAESHLAELSGMSKITSDGIQFGADSMIGKRTVVGAMFSYERALSVLNVNNRMVGDNYSFGFYGAHQFRSGFDALALFGYGRQDYASRRFDLNAVTNTASFSGSTFEMTLEGGRRYRLNSNLWLRPAVAFDIYNNDVDKFTEVGDGALNFGSMSLTQAFVRVGGDLIFKKNRCAMNSGFYYSYQMSQHGNQVRTTVNNGGANAGVVGSDLGRNKLTFNVGGSYAMGQRKALSTFGGYNGDYFTDRAGKPWGHNAYVGMRYQF
ncbi:MAG: autotransporter domain-containing protein [Thermoguttaceae bacterium]